MQREIRRGRKYDAIIMDPPSYGRGPSGETWKIEEDVADFIDLTMGVLSDKPLFVLISSYSTGLAPSVMRYLLGITAGKRAAGKIEAQELACRSNRPVWCCHAARRHGLSPRNKQNRKWRIENGKCNPDAKFLLRSTNC